MGLKLLCYLKYIFTNIFFLNISHLVISNFADAKEFIKKKLTVSKKKYLQTGVSYIIIIPLTWKPNNMFEMYRRTACKVLGSSVKTFLVSLLDLFKLTRQTVIFGAI